MTTSRPAGSLSAKTSHLETSRVELILFAGVLFAFGFSWMFRKWLFDGFDGIFGDVGDARILIAVLEHWYRTLSGHGSGWLNPPFFYPTPGVLGFTDAYFLYGIAYAPLRVAGIDPFTAFMLVMAALAAIGFFGFLRLAMVDFGVSAASAAVGAFLFAFGNMMALKMGHAQSYCAMLLPVLAHLTAMAFKAESKRTAIIAAFAAGLLHALIFLTAYLTGWFATFFAIVFLLIVVALRGVRTARADLAYVLTAKRHVFAAWLAGFAIGIVPFLIVYGPIWLQGFRRAFSEPVHYAPAFYDIINVGRANWLWGWLVTSGIIGAAHRPSDELELGFTPGVAILYLVIITLALRTRRRTEPQEIDAKTAVVIALGLSLVTCLLLQLRWFGLRPWYVVWALVPGASAIRTTFRFQIVLNLIAAILVALALDRIRCWSAARAPLVGKVTAGLIAGFLVVEQLNRAPPVFSRAEQLAWLGSMAAPPAQCRAFYLAPGSLPAGTPWWALQSDAMLLAVRFGLPTVNGNASIYPAHWQLRDLSKPDYAQDLRDWTARHNLASALCGLQSRTGPWTVGPP